MSVTSIGKKVPSLPQIVDFLEQATNLRVISAWLKERDLPHTTGSWKQLLEERLQPAIDEKKISLQDVLSLLSDVEEYGPCHVFLYKCEAKVAHDLIRRENVEAIAKNLGIEHLLKNPSVTALPSEPTISGIRLNDETEGGSLSFKIVETRDYEERVEEKVENKRIVTYTTKKARAVNVVRLTSIGVLEVRIHSHANDDYEPDIKKNWHELLPEFLPVNLFKTLALVKLQDALWKKREEMKEFYRYSDAKLRDEYGCVLSGATPKKVSDLSKQTSESLQMLLNNGGRQESSGMWWKEQKSGIPSTEIHVWLSGKPNEFTLRASSTKADFEYVLVQFSRFVI